LPFAALRFGFHEALSGSRLIQPVELAFSDMRPVAGKDHPRALEER
jgi:hypothetical protein